MSSSSSGGNYHTDNNFDQTSDTTSSTNINNSNNDNNNLMTRSSASSFLTNSSSTHTKHEDLKLMLESNKDGLKLEAMKRIIGMIAKGRSGESPRELFAHVVKNVVTKNAELKKLVYLYLTRYAEQEQDLALLSIATFQRSLKDPNPLIRASAIRVLSSIRVSMIAPIMLIAIRDCSNDMSPYVRKTAAHAIPKLYSLDPDLKNEIIDIIERLLNDKTSLVLGSAVAAFEEVCPQRFDLIHSNYRKFCSLLVDVDEWGQIILINMLIRYARTQFTDPNSKSITDVESPPILDSDHRMLLRSAKPLLQSRNSGVVLAVIQLYLSLAPNSEINSILVKPLIRLLHSHREIQLVVLKNIVTLTAMTDEDNDNTTKPITTLKGSENEENPEEDPEEDEDEDRIFDNISSKKCVKTLFEPYLKSFFIKAKDSTNVKVLKLEIMTNLSNSSNISLILREFQAYIMNYQEDLEFMSATIQSIGQCASRIKEIAPICLNGLISLLSNRNEAIVAQSIVVIRTQIINKDESIISMIIKQVTKLMDKITTPQARATILWILAEFCHRNERASKYAPDVLRKIAKTFCNESDIVKLQALNLASKLYITNENSDRLKLLVNFIFNLAKYDLNYDVRDRGRILRQLLNDVTLAKRILLTPKCVPNISKAVSTGNVDNSRFRIGTLSHFIGKKVSDYEELPDWPEVQPDTSVRAKLESFEEPTFALVNIKETNVRKKKENGFYSSGESDEESETDDEENEDNSEDLSDEESLSLEDESDDEFDDEEEEEDDEEEDEEQSSTEASDSESSVEVKPISNPHSSKTKPTISNIKNTELIQRKEKETKTKASKETKPKAPVVDFLLDLDDMSSMPSNASLILSPMGSIQTQPTPTPSDPYRIIETAEKIPTTTYQLIGVTAKFKIIYRFPRMRDNIQTLVELIINSDCEQSMTISGANSVEFKGLQTKELSLKLSSGEIKLVTIGIDFNESPSQGIDITINDTLKAKIVAPIGEIVIPVRFTDSESFKSEQIKLKGMNEVIEKIVIKTGISDELISDTVLKVANLGTNKFVEQNILRYSGATLKFKSLVLVTIEKNDNFIKQTVNCEKMIIGSMLSKALKDSFLKL